MAARRHLYAVAAAVRCPWHQLQGYQGAAQCYDYRHRRNRCHDAGHPTWIGVISKGVLTGPITAYGNGDDNIMPVAIVQSLTPFWAGVIIIGPIAATISVSSLLLSSSSSIVKDVYMNIKGKREERLSNNQIRLYSLGATIILGLFVYAIAIKPPSVIWQINMFAFGSLETAANTGTDFRSFLAQGQ